jgi:hypothetical protein
MSRVSGLTFKAIIVNYDPHVHTAPFVESPARKLCVTGDDATDGPKMKAAIKVSQMTLQRVLGQTSTKVTGSLTDPQINSLDDATKCDNTKFKIRGFSRSVRRDQQSRRGHAAQQSACKGSPAGSRRVRDRQEGQNFGTAAILAEPHVTRCRTSGTINPDLVDQLQNLREPTQ